MTLDLAALRRQAEACGEVWRRFGGGDLVGLHPSVVLELLDTIASADAEADSDAERADALASQVAALREVLREIVVNGWCPCVGVAKKGLDQ